jgi:ribosomal RNA-processing protein 12
MNGKVVNTSDLSDQSKLAGTQHDDVAMRQFSEKILPTLFQLVEDLSYTNAAELGPMNGTTDASGEDIRSSQADALTHAIASIAKLASKEFIQNRLFTRVMHRLLEASQTQEDLSDKMCCLLTLSQALYTSKCLSEPSVVLLYRALRPLVGTDETGPRVQKRSYKLLAELCKSKSFITADGRLKEIVELLTSSTSSSQIAARAMRLRCIAEITDSLRGTPELDEVSRFRIDLLGLDSLRGNLIFFFGILQWVLISLLGEILLCLKDSKNKTREAASALLISVSRAGDVLVLIRGIAAAVASETSHMRSAAITALSKIVLEHGRSDGRVQNLMPSLIQTVLLLSADPSREVSKSLIVFLRVAISTCPLEMIRTFLPAILESLLGYHKGKDRFRGKIEITMKKLLRLYGLNCLLALVTESECRSSNYLKKLAKSESKNKKSRKGSIREKSVDEMMASDEEDSDEELTSTRVARGRDQQDRSRKRGYPEEDEGIARFNRQVLIRNNSIVGFEVKDLASSVRQHCLESDSDNDDVITFDERGRLIISSRSNDAQQREEDHAGTLATSSNSKKPGTSVHAGHHQTSKKLGDAYMSKKAGGDVRRKGQKFDPYAYVPLDGKSYTKKNRRHAVEQLDTVVRGRKRQKR